MGWRPSDPGGGLGRLTRVDDYGEVWGRCSNRGARGSREVGALGWTDSREWPDQDFLFRHGSFLLSDGLGDLLRVGRSAPLGGIQPAGLRTALVTRRYRGGYLAKQTQGHFAIESNIGVPESPVN